MKETLVGLILGMYTTHTKYMMSIVFQRGQRSSEVTRGKKLNNLMRGAPINVIPSAYINHPEQETFADFGHGQRSFEVTRGQILKNTNL